MRPVQALGPDVVARLCSAPLTYPEELPYPAELSGGDRLFPPGFRSLFEEVILPPDVALDRAAEELLRWQVQCRAGFRVAASVPRIEQGAVALLSMGIGPLALRSPVRVVQVIDEADRRGFADGTLPGHPESGREAFVLQRDPAVTATQRLITRRYLRTFQ